MRLNDLLTTVINSSPDQWSTLTPPSLFHLRFPGDDVQFALVEHTSAATYVEDVSIGLQWGLDDQPWEGVWTEWAQRFPDKRVTGQFLEVTWQGRPVHRQVIVVVDGGRFRLPAPSPTLSGPQDEETVSEWRVERDAVAIARLVHEIANPHDDFDRGMSTARFVVEG